MAKETTKQEYNKKIKELTYALAIANRQNELLKKKVNEFEKDLDEAYRDTEDILEMIHNGLETAEEHYTTLMEEAGGIKVRDVIYQYDILYRLAHTHYNRNSIKDEE